jgi:hypothetical protein
MIMNQGLIRRPARARGNAAPGADDGIAMLLVIMAVLIVAALSVLALGAIVVQANPTQFQRKNTQTINAAEGGLDAALAAIRGATYVEGGVTYGDRSALPCWTNYVGQIGDPGGTALTYTVTISYFKSDPSAQTAAWRALNKMTCFDGVGTTTTPTHAFITSDGGGLALAHKSAQVANRTLQSVYTFKVTNPNLPGGLIKDDGGLCYSGGSSVGSAVKVTTCLPGDNAQMWAYTKDYQIVLTSTRAADGTGGLCLSARLGALAKVNATMQTCDPSAADYTQTWGVNNNDPVQFFGHLRGVFSSSWCLGVVAPEAVGSVLSVGTGTTCVGVFPQPQVGAGAAGTTLGSPDLVSDQPFQWVNYKEFGRCLDITAYNTNTVSEIIYPCKQDPMRDSDPAAVPGWNEVFTWNMTSKHFWANSGGGSGPAYCMRSPNTVDGYVTFANLCSSISGAAYTWTMNRDTGDPRTSYTIVDSYGRCLAGGDPNPTNASAYSSVTTAICDGGTGQKWNAPPNLSVASVGDTAEVPNH